MHGAVRGAEAADSFVHRSDVLWSILFVFKKKYNTLRSILLFIIIIGKKLERDELENYDMYVWQPLHKVSPSITCKNTMLWFYSSCMWWHHVDSDTFFLLLPGQVTTSLQGFTKTIRSHHGTVILSRQDMHCTWCSMCSKAPGLLKCHMISIPCNLNVDICFKFASGFLQALLLANIRKHSRVFIWWPASIHWLRHPAD